MPPVEHESLREPLRDTLGVVVFQDQVLDVAMASAGFSVGEAEGLRRAMSRKRSEEAIEAFRPRFVAGCLGNGIDEQTAHAIYDKLVGFSGFGFPKSHAAAFALLAYQSAWLRHYYPAEFLCALLNAQPMGFYPPSSLVRDAQRRGVEVRPPHVNRSAAQVRDRGRRACGSGSATSARSARRRRRRSSTGSRTPTLGDLARRAPRWRRTRSRRSSRRARATSGARGASCSGGSARRRAARAPAAARASSRCRSSRPPRRPSCPRRPTGSGCSPTTGTRPLSVGVHPLELLRPHLARRRHERRARTTSRTARSRSRRAWRSRASARRPRTAIVFMLLEDEHGQVNLIVPPPVYEAHRAIVRGEPLLLARGRFERVGRNVNVLVDELETLGPLARRAASEAEVAPRCRARTTSATADRRSGTLAVHAS